MTESLNQLGELTKKICDVLDVDAQVVSTVDEKLAKAESFIKDARETLQDASDASRAKDEAATAASTAKDEAATLVSTAKDEAATLLSKANDAAVGEAKDAQIAQLTIDLKIAVDKNNN